MHSLEISDLHSWSAAENVGSLTHKLGSLNFSPRSNNLGFSGTLTLRSHRERILEILAEDDILDKQGLNLNTPTKRRLLDNLTDRLSNLLTTLNHILQHTRTNNMAKSRLRTLHKRLADVGDGESGLVGRGDAVVDDGCQLEGDVVLGHADLLGNFDDLDLDVDLDELL